MPDTLSVVETAPKPVTAPIHAPAETSTSAASAASSNELDFIGSSAAVKELFALPYSTGRSVSVAVHNVGGTLIIDSDHEAFHQQPVLKRRQEPSAKEKESDSKEEGMSRSLVPLSSMDLDSEALSIVNSVIESNRKQKNDIMPKVESTTPCELGLPQPDDYVHRFIPPAPEPREYLSWKFHDLNLLVGSDALIYRSPETETALTVRVEEAKEMKRLLQKHEAMIQSGQFLPDHSHNVMEQQGRLSYAEAIRKTLPPAEKAEQTTSQQGSFSAPDLGQVRLQTCVVPAPNSPVGGLLSSSTSAAKIDADVQPLSPVSTVLDIYLDNIMANVPQLALCLKEKGFVQSVKLLQTDSIPSGLMHPSTLDTSSPFQVMDNPQAEKIFSPDIMETNARALLRFLRTNCTTDNATYLLRREAGHSIQLYDITTISRQGQRKWIWWLAMMSYRFANRLRHLSQTADGPLRRTCRNRQRSLLQNVLELLETLQDMDGGKHESLCAAVCENLADTFLGFDEEEAERAMPIVIPAPAVSTQQPYGSLSVDALNKAQDHLKQGMKALKPLLDGHLRKRKPSDMPKHGTDQSSLHVTVVSVKETTLDDDDDDSSSDDDLPNTPFQERIDPLVTQLFGLHHKFVNVSLRLAEIHLRNYYSSSAMQALRTSARCIADSLYLAELVDPKDKRVTEWLGAVQLQYTWLWEHCGHFARSFAADDLWRERGHAAGDDILSVLQDAESAFTAHEGLQNASSSIHFRFVQPTASLLERSNGAVNLRSLTGVVAFQPPLGKNKTETQKSPSLDDLKRTEEYLNGQRIILREQRKVLVAACVAYNMAIESFRMMLSHDVENDGLLSDSKLMSLFKQRLGDACNEVGKIMLNELRTLLGDPANQTREPTENVAILAETLLSSSQFWFFEGLAAFEDCKDLRNLALLRCNLCQTFKLRANAIFAADSSAKVDSTSPTHAEFCLQEAANHLQSAHESLGERDVDSVTWDMVSEELAATFLVLGVRRRQSLIGSGNMPLIMQALRLSPGKENSIVDPMERALAIYQQLGNQHQVAAANYQLALFYSKIWTCQLNEAKTREKLSSAFSHFHAAHAYFSQAVRGNEITFCILSIDMSSLYAAVSNEEECTGRALMCCVDTLNAFSKETIDAVVSDMQSRTEWCTKMETLSSSIEERSFKLLRNLVKLEENDGKNSSRFKDLYRKALTAKMSPCKEVETSDVKIDSIANRLLTLHGILRVIRDGYRKTSS